MNKRQGAAVREGLSRSILSSDEFGECNAMARNISAGGILRRALRAAAARHRRPGPLLDARLAGDHRRARRGEEPLLPQLHRRRAGPRSLTGMAVRFTEFEAESRKMLGLGLTRMRILH